MMVSDDNKIEAIRIEIDRIDKNLVELIDIRLGMSRDIGKIKKESGLEINSPEREEQIFRNVLEQETRNISEETLRRIFQLIIQESLSVQQKVLKDIND
jgi:chorismate mutase